ncbi:extracellular tyrosine-protein kinase PKDCC [Polymixia lowei]
MKRRRMMVAAGVCLSFLLATFMNLFSVHQTDHMFRFYREKQLQHRTPGARAARRSPRELQLHIRERFYQVVQVRARGPDRTEPVLDRRRLMDLDPSENREPVRVQTPNPASHRGVSHRGVSTGPPLGCSSINNLTGVRFLGSGFTKTVYRADLNRSFSVALKSVDLNGHDMDNCVKTYGVTGDCYRLASFKLVKEMILMQRLQHPNVLTLYGYCYQETSGIQDTVTAITELGSPLEMIHLLQTPWEERFRICLGLVRLLDFLSRSPLGSVSLLDFRPRQFVLVEGELKVTDLDDASAEEAPCPPSPPHHCIMDFPARNFSLPCHRGRCVGINEKRNLYNAYRFFFTYLLPHSAPASLRPLLDRIVNATGELLWGVEETLVQMEKVLHLYRTGLYLQNLSHTHTADYREVLDSSIPEQNYRCWPSFQHDACLLSVFSLQEAVRVCESHAHCTAFVLTNQRTWTGHQLVYFKSGCSGLTQASGQVTYIRPTWTHLNPPEPTWTHLNPPEPTWTHLNPPRPTWTHLNPPEPTWTHLNPPEPTLTHLDPHGPTRTHLNPPRPTWTHLNPPEPTWTHLNPHGPT